MKHISATVSCYLRRSVNPIATVLLLSFVAGCEGSVFTEVEDNASRSGTSGAVRLDSNPTVPVTGIRLLDATLTVSGQEFPSRIQQLNHDGPFWLIMLWVDQQGLFLVGTEALGLASEAGRFKGSKLEFTCGDTTVTLQNDSESILSDDSERTAYAIYLPGFRIVDVDTRAPDRVIGIVSDLNQVPGFDQNDLDLAVCQRRQR